MLSFPTIKSEQERNRYRGVLTELAFWFVFLVLLAFGAEWNEKDIGRQIKELCIFLTPILIAVYAHSYIFNRFFLQRKFHYYSLLCLLLILVIYYSSTFIYKTYIPDNQPSILGGLFLFILMHTGFRYLIVAPKQSLRIKEEEARRVKAERDLQELEAKQSKAELEFLKSQINPHFLFNSLNGIYSLTMDNPEKAGEAILTLSDLLRYNLESSKNKFVTLNRELEFLDSYIQLESMRLGDNCTINLKKKGEFQSRTIAPLILMPFVENCFKHGIGTDKSNNYIHISISLEDNKLTFNTENRIASSRMNNHNESIKIGIENVKRRLEMIYPNRYKLELLSNHNLYKVQLLIEL